MTTNDIDAIRKLTDAASEAPWTAHPDGLVWARRIGDPVSASTEIEDAEFIAAARTHVPALCDEVEQLRAAHDSAVQAIAEVESDIDDRDSEISSLKSDLDLQTKAAWANRSEANHLHALVKTLTAERDAARDMANTARHETAQALHALDKARAENETLKQQLAEAETRHGNTIEDRDDYQTMADRLADAIAKLSGVEIGEHSSGNDPWMRALDAAEALAARRKDDEAKFGKPCCGYRCQDNTTGVAS